MENKIYSIAYESKFQKRKGMYTTITYSSHRANEEGVKKLIKDNGDLIWEPQMMTVSELPTSQDKDKNYLLACILNNNDLQLYQAGKKYLTANEIKFLDNKLNENTTQK